MSNRRLKIGLDFHGVITSNPAFFKDFTALALSRGHEIHILTGGPYDKVKAQLAEWQIPWTELYAILDYYEKKGEVKFFANGEFKVDDVLWDIAKAKYCVDHQIDFHIDDSKQYAKWFVTPFCYYNKERQNCTTDQKIALDFSRPAPDVVKAIENLTLCENSES